MKYKEQIILMLLVLYTSSRPPFIVINIAIVILFLYSAFLFKKYGKNFDKNIINIVIIYLASIFYYFLAFGWIDFFQSAKMLIVIMIGYMVITLMGIRFLTLFDKILYTLTVISLILYPIQVLLFDQTLSIVTLTSSFIPLNEQGDELKSILLWGIDYGADNRNSGFVWEPKAFANFLLIGVFFNLIVNKFKVNKRLVVYIIALLTTLSSTGFIIMFFVIPLFILWNTNTQRFFIYLIPSIIFAPFIFGLDFVSEKAIFEWNSRYDYVNLLHDNRNFEKRSLGRLPSMMVDYQDFLKQPIVGFGMQKDERTQSRYTKLVRVNGLTDWLASFGVIGMILLIVGYSKGWGNILTLYRLRGRIFIVVALLMIFFATTVTNHTFWICLLFTFLIDPKKESFLLNGSNSESNSVDVYNKPSSKNN